MKTVILAGAALVSAFSIAAAVPALAGTSNCTGVNITPALPNGRYQEMDGTTKVDLQVLEYSFLDGNGNPHGGLAMRLQPTVQVPNMAHVVSCIFNSSEGLMINGWPNGLPAANSEQIGGYIEYVEKRGTAKAALQAAAAELVFNQASPTPIVWTNPGKAEHPFLHAYVQKLIAKPPKPYVTPLAGLTLVDDQGVSSTYELGELPPPPQNPK